MFISPDLTPEYELCKKTYHFTISFNENFWFVFAKSGLIVSMHVSIISDQKE